MAFNFQSLGRVARSAIRLLTSPSRSTANPKSPAGKAGRPAAAVPTSKVPAKRSGALPAEGLSSPYPGDYNVDGALKPKYSPSPDGNPDPGEIVWTWVPYEEDFTRGKDRPVLIIGASGAYLLALMLTSKDHDGGRAPSVDYVDVGAGAWDRQGRPSEVKLDRVLRIRESDVRREGAVLGKAEFQLVAAALAERHDRSAPRR